MRYLKPQVSSEPGIGDGGGMAGERPGTAEGVADAARVNLVKPFMKRFGGVSREFLIEARKGYEARRAAQGLAGLDLELPEETMSPLSHLPGSGTRAPEGTEKQSAWALSIKRSVWPFLKRKAADRLQDDPTNDYKYLLRMLAEAGYPEEVIPLARATAYARWLVAFDRLDSEFWINLKLYGRPSPSTHQVEARECLTAPPVNRYPRDLANIAVRKVSLAPYPRVRRFLENYPDPDGWRSYLTKRGVCHDDGIGERERETFRRAAEAASQGVQPVRPDRRPRERPPFSHTMTGCY